MIQNEIGRDGANGQMKEPVHYLDCTGSWVNIGFRLPAGRDFSLSLDENTSLIAFLDSPVSILRTLMAVSDRYDCKIAVS